MTKFPPYAYQNLVRERVTAGQNLVLQAPTGAGKTRAAISPGIVGFFRSAHDYPSRMIYGVPMRVLGRKFKQDYEDIAREDGWQREWYPSIQTGEQPEDELFEGRVIFATVDQIIASFLNIPYGLPAKLDNINAGAMLGSYLIFDEFHLYPRGEMMLTVLAMLKMLRGISRFILMSATFSPVFLQKIADVLGAEMLADPPGTPVSNGLFKDVTSVQTQQRRFHAEAGPLDVVAVQRCASDVRRMLCICNTVPRAQALYLALRSSPALAGFDIHLLHSRFYREDRNKIEAAVIERFSTSDGRPTIVVATQVIEVGLDISADVLLTECAPAASLIQRAGRCARRAHESGRVHVFQPYDDEGNVNYAPYVEEGQEAVCEKTWAALASSDFDGQIIGFSQEQQLVDRAHSEADQRFVDGLDAAIQTRIDEIAACLRTREAGWSNRLIRQQGSVPLYIDASPKDNTLLTTKPWECEAISLSKGQLARFMEAYGSDEQDAPFLLCAGVERPPDEEATNNKSWYDWRPVRDVNDVYTNWKFVAHPLAVTYTPDLGLMLQPSAHPAPASPTVPPKSWTRPVIHAERFHEHIAGLYWAYTKPPGNAQRFTALREEALYPLRKLCERFGKDVATGERMLRLALALHDVGKLNRPWQDWAHGWQRLYQQNGFQPTLDPDDADPLAHTDYDGDNDEQWRLQQAYNRTRTRGPHAGESAEACLGVFWAASGEDEFWTAVTAAAVMRHHTPSVSGCGAFQLSAGSHASLRRALGVCGFSAEADGWIDLITPSFTGESDDLLTFVADVDPSLNRYDVALMYLLFVRILRLADQRSGHYWRQYRDSLPLPDAPTEMSR